MINLYPLISFIQFIGAFNFAFVYTKYEEKVLAKILDIENVFQRRFHDLDEIILSFLITFNEDKYKDLGGEFEKQFKYIYSRLKSYKNIVGAVKARVKSIISTYLNKTYSCPLFLFCGMYTIFIVFVLSILEMEWDRKIYDSTAFCNALSLFVIAYFFVCEIIKYVKPLSEWMIFRPTLLFALSASLIIPLLGVLNWILLCKYGPCIVISHDMCNELMWYSVVIPLSCFMFTGFLFFIYYVVFCILIRYNIRNLKIKFKSIIFNKKSLDEVFINAKPNPIMSMVSSTTGIIDSSTPDITTSKKTKKQRELENLKRKYKAKHKRRIRKG